MQPRPLSGPPDARLAPAPPWTRFDTAETLAAFGGRIAAELAAGDAVCLFGPLGAGKSTLARGLLRARLADDALEAPSPTFTLVQSYGGADLEIAHFDLYRLTRREEVDELGLDEALEVGAAVIEWSERLGDDLPPDRLEVRLTREPPPGEAAIDARWVRLRGAGAWTDARLARVAP